MQSNSIGVMIFRLVIAAVAVLITAELLSGVILANFWVAILVAFLLAVVNTYLKPLLMLISLPLTILTFGLFLLVINVLMIYLVDGLVPGFEVLGFWWALLFSIVQSLINSLFQNAF